MSDRGDRQRDQRPLHVPADVVEVLARMMIEALRAMEGHEDHAEGIERGDEHAEQHAASRHSPRHSACEACTASISASLE